MVIGFVLLFSFVWILFCSNRLQSIEVLHRKKIKTTSHCLSAIAVMLVSCMNLENTPQKNGNPLLEVLNIDIISPS